MKSKEVKALQTKNKAYFELVKNTMPKSNHVITMVRAFIVGGVICMIGQGIGDLYGELLKNAPKDDIRSYTTITLIFITAVLTGTGIYDKIGAFGGAGSIIPITGFANSVVSPAMEFKREGVVLGLCANMFTVAGPVIVVGITASVVVGFVVLAFGGMFA